MSFRKKLLAVLTATVVVTTLAVSIAVAAIARRAFQRQEAARGQSIAAQFRREFDRSGDDVVRRVSAIATSDVLRRIAVDSAHSREGAYINEAAQLAQSNSLDFLEFVEADGAIVSSAEFPARFGYRDEWSGSLARLSSSGASLRRQQLPNGSTLGIFAVSAVAGGEQPLYVVGGVRLDPELINSIPVPSDSYVFLWTDVARNPSVDCGEVNRAFQAAVESGKEVEALVSCSHNPERLGPQQTLHVVPLKAMDENVLGALLISTSREELDRTEQYIRSVALVVAAAGILLAILISGWVATRVTRPVERLAAGASRVATGNWDARVDVHSADELGQLADAFNRMTAELLNQRDRLVQAERVAAWRELARRLAHELKNPLFPLQITVENLVRARQLAPAEFDEVFRESTATLLTELANLRSIIGRFSDFSKMPKPHLEPASVNEIVQQVARAHEAQLTNREHPIALSLQLDPNSPVIDADPTLIHRALSNLVLNAIDAMPEGGTLTLRTRQNSSAASIEVQDSGAGMTREERERLFTPYYTTKQHGTGLGLAIVQSVVSDHGGRITVESETARGTKFSIELPLSREAVHRENTEDSQRNTEQIFSEPR
jgi:signal transduction histidine kinase